MTSYPVSAYICKIYLYRSLCYWSEKTDFSAHKIIMEEMVGISYYIHSDLFLIPLSRNCHTILLLLHGQCPRGESKGRCIEANRRESIARYRLLHRYRKQGLPLEAKPNR